jgi:hypothetical protein
MVSDGCEVKWTATLILFMDTGSMGVTKMLNIIGLCRHAMVKMIF